MPPPMIGYCLLPAVLLLLNRLSAFTSCLSMMKASARLSGGLYDLRVGSGRAFGAWRGAKSGTPPGYSPKCKNEPEKYFRINKNAQKRT
jgi:hypothetical protein